MCMSMGSIPKPKAPPPPVEAPTIDIGGTSDDPQDVRQRSARGRNRLRTDLTIPTTGSGLAIPQ